MRLDHPALAAAAGRGVPVRSEIDLAGERAGAPIVAVTGTNGKTTVTTLDRRDARTRRAAHAVAAGNVGRPLIDAVDDAVDVLVAEVSSFQLACSETFHPHVAVVLAITPDHLDWHGSYERYVAAKARITRHQTRRRPARVRRRRRRRADDRGARAPRVRSASRAAPTRPATRARSTASSSPPTATSSRAVADMRRALVHDRTNALAAALGRARGRRDDRRGPRPRWRSYATLPHRVALVGEAGGVRWYDDSKATNPDATLRALESFDSVVLLAGGRNKGLDLGVLAARADRVRGVVAFGEAGARGRRRVPRTVARSSTARLDARRRARRGRRSRSRATRCCCRPRARRSTRTRTTPSAATTSPPRFGELLAEGAPTDDRRSRPALRVPAVRSAARRSRGAASEIVRRHRALPRPPTYVILCATVGVLNIVGLVMILSASSVAGAQRLRLVVVLLRPPARSGRSAA